MPHKHKRKRADDESNYDLPPSTRARPLMASALTKQESIFTSDKEKKEKKQAKKQNQPQKKKSDNNGFEDDTPKAFLRLMAFQRGEGRKRSGLDDGERLTKKQKKMKSKAGTNLNSNSNGSGSGRGGQKDSHHENENGAGTTGKTKDKDLTGQDAAGESSTAATATKVTSNSNNNKSTTTKSTTTNTTTTTTPMLKILPGERLSDFAARVDQSLPLSTIPKQTTRIAKIAGLENLKTPLTKHNKRLARLQSEWRNTEARLRAKREEEAEELADQREEHDIVWLGAGIDARVGGGGGSNIGGIGMTGGGGNKKKKKKQQKKKGSGGGGDDDDDDDDVDPWKQLERKRREQGDLGRPRNLQDVVQAPPVLKSVKNIFKDKGERVKVPLPLPPPPQPNLKSKPTSLVRRR